MILGITGGTGCGKTTLLEAVRRRGGLTLDCDAVYHALLASDQEMLDSLRESFPECFQGGGLQRKQLGALVFSDPQALALLNRITHTAVKREIKRCLSPAPELAAIDAIALLESGLGELCDVTVAVLAPREDRIKRLIRRDGITRQYAESRIDAQHPDAWFRERCDYTLENNGTCEEFSAKCEEFLNTIKKNGGKSHEH